MNLGKQHGLDVEKDKAGNVRLRKKASKGCENSVALVYLFLSFILYKNSKYQTYRNDRMLRGRA